MGRHDRGEDGPDLAALIETWGPIAPAPRTPTGDMRCPRCRSDQTVRHGARAHCGTCDTEWLLGADLDGQRDRTQARQALDAWAAGRPDGADR